MRKIIASAVVGILGVSLAACSGEGPASERAFAGPGPDALASAEGVTTVTFWHGLGGTIGEEMDSLIAEFNAENEGSIKVEASYQGSYADLLAKYSAGLRDDSTPTVLLASDVASGYLNDVQRSVAPATMAAANPDDLDLGDIRTAARNYYSSDGQMIAVPFAMSTPVLWVNTDLLDAAGIDPETDLSTIEDLATAVSKIKEATGTAGLVFPMDGWWFEQMTAAAGDVYCTPDNGRGSEGGATAVSLTEPNQVAAFQSLLDIYTDGAGLDVGTDFFAALNAFNAGQAAIMLNSSGSASGIAAGDVPFGYEAVPFPMSATSDDSGTVIGGTALWLGSNATDAEKVAGWKFISYLASADTQEKFSSITGYIPVNTAVDDMAERQAYLADNPSAQVFVDQINNTPEVSATAGCLSGAMTTIRSAVVSQMQSAFAGTISLDEALAQAEQDANDAVDQYREQLG